MKPHLIKPTESVERYITDTKNRCDVFSHVNNWITVTLKEPLARCFRDVNILTIVKQAQLDTFYFKDIPTTSLNS